MRYKSRPPRALWELVAPVIALVGIVLLARGCIAVATHQAEWAPVKLKPISVSPDVLTIGQPGTLINGVCLDQDEPLTVQVYMGLQDAAPNPLLGARIIDIVGVNTQEGRKRVTLSKGCANDRTDFAAVPPSLDPGRWRIIVTIVALGPAGQTQIITEQSKPFIIRAPDSPN